MTKHTRCAGSGVLFDNDILYTDGRGAIEGVPVYWVRKECPRQAGKLTYSAGNEVRVVDDDGEFTFVNPPRPTVFDQDRTGETMTVLQSMDGIV